MSVLLVGLYLLPLIPIYIQFEAIYSLGATLICLGMLKYELMRRSTLKPFPTIRIDQREKWHLVNLEGKLKSITFKNFMWFGPILFLLFILNGKQQRVMVFENQQNTTHYHKLKVYLKGTT